MTKKKTEYNNSYDKQRRKKDKTYSILKYTRSHVSNAIRGKRTCKIGYAKCTGKFLKRYISFLLVFYPKFNLENYGAVWQIDHILPIRKNNKNVLGRLVWYNLKPMCKIKNRKKGSGGKK